MDHLVHHSGGCRCHRGICKPWKASLTCYGGMRRCLPCFILALRPCAPARTSRTLACHPLVSCSFTLMPCAPYLGHHLACSATNLETKGSLGLNLSTNARYTRSTLDRLPVRVVHDCTAAPRGSHSSARSWPSGHSSPTLKGCLLGYPSVPNPPW